MKAPRRVIIDTNVFVSAIILPLSIPRQAVDKALGQGVLLFSEATMSELAEVLFREKLDRYVSREEREGFLRQLSGMVEFVPIVHRVRECRDPRDDKFLEVALNGRAQVIVTGDADLLRMGPWRRIGIVAPEEYLRR
jgi:putative PIN family toxin of toxin-antitoxin system